MTNAEIQRAQNIKEWRLKRCNRRCAYCANCRLHVRELLSQTLSWYTCEPKGKQVNKRMPRPFCALYEVDYEAILDYVNRRCETIQRRTGRDPESESNSAILGLDECSNSK